ncbi:MAG: hypothetical protein QJR13_07940, partial [Bacillota bacterium]|nr:hypothetical protein [Bacillota bacterium]
MKLTIKNQSTNNDPQIGQLRAAIEHRATWFYLLLDEFRKKMPGEAWEEVARRAIHRCGVLHGNQKFSRTADLRRFAEEFANEVTQKVFEM